MFWDWIINGRNRKLKYMKITDYFIIRQEVDIMEKTICQLVKESNTLIRRREALKEIADRFEDEMNDRVREQLKQ